MRVSRRDAKKLDFAGNVETRREEALAIISSTLPEAALELRKLIGKDWDNISGRLASTNEAGSSRGLC